MNQASGTFLTSLKETSLFAYRLYPNCHEHLHSFIFSFFLEVDNEQDLWDILEIFKGNIAWHVTFRPVYPSERKVTYSYRYPNLSGLFWH